LEYPVVILNDLSAPFRGADHDEVLLEEKFGIAPRAFDEKAMTKNNTLLRLLCKLKQLENSVADELNLYYVALTRAQESLHLIFKEPTPFTDVKYAKSFADFTDFSVWEKYVVEDELLDLPKQERGDYVHNPDGDAVRKIEKAFTWKYAHTGYENLPVKSSASQLLSARDKTPYVPQETFVDEPEMGRAAKTSVEQGLAYHAFLERLDFSKLFDANGRYLDEPALRALIAELCEGYKRSLDCDWVQWIEEEKLFRILTNPIFATLQDKVLYKEQKFLVSLPVKDTYAKYAEDGYGLDGEEMIFQGAIDLLAVDENGAWVIDYKDSIKDADALKKHYAPQLELYRMTVAKIMKLPIEKIRCILVNLHHGFQVEV
jgi:ATP-dependent helicase/nuclease subunit A